MDMNSQISIAYVCQELFFRPEAIKVAKVIGMAERF
jgi:hypothetical protein